MPELLDGYLQVSFAAMFKRNVVHVGVGKCSKAYARPQVCLAYVYLHIYNIRTVVIKKVRIGISIFSPRTQLLEINDHMISVERLRNLHPAGPFKKISGSKPLSVSLSSRSFYPHCCLGMQRDAKQLSLFFHLR